MSKNCIDIHTPHLKSKFNKLIKSGVKEKDAELEIAIEEAKRIFNSLNNLKTKLGLKLSEEDEITNAIVTTKAEDFQDLSETFDLEWELKTNIAALEKIIKDAESEDAPATVKQELIEKGNAKLAEMKAELAAMQQSKNETNSIDDKKADIERRRQEELFGNITALEFETTDTKGRLRKTTIKTKVDENGFKYSFETTVEGKSSSTSAPKVSKDQIKNSSIYENLDQNSKDFIDELPDDAVIFLQSIAISTDKNSAAGLGNGNITIGYASKSEGGRVDDIVLKYQPNKINAKYDAELKELDQPTSNQSEQDKKADIEKRKQEGTNLRGTTYKGETTEKDGLKITKYSEFFPDGRRISKGGRIMTPAEFIKEYNIIDQDYLDSLEGATEIRIYEVREGKDTTGISIQGSFPEENIEMVVSGANTAALETPTSTRSGKADIERRRQEELPIINVYWGSAETTTNTRLLSNLAPRKFTYKGKEYGSVEHAYQTLKSGEFDQITYDKYVKAGGYGTKIRGKQVNKGFNNLQLMKDLVVESFKQNPEQAKLLLKYKDFTHTTNEIIDKAFLEGLKLAKYDVELAALTKQDTPETEISGKEQLDALFGEVVTPQPTKKQELIEKLRRLAKEKIEESKLQSTSEFNYRGGTYTIDYNRNLLSPIPKTATAQKNLIDSIGKQDIYDVINSTINSKDVYLVFNKNLNKFVVLDKNLNSIPLDESVVTSKAYQDAKNRCK